MNIRQWSPIANNSTANSSIANNSIANNSITRKMSACLRGVTQGMGAFCCLGLLWLLPSATRPTLAQIQPYPVDIELFVSEDTAFDIVIEEAEALAAGAIDQAFFSDPAIFAVRVTVVGIQGTKVVPVLFSEVSRTEWEEFPRIDRWSEYPASAIVLLDLVGAGDEADEDFFLSPTPLFSDDLIDVENDPGFRDD